MLGLRRARLHLRIAEMLEARFGTDDPMALPQLAYHFSEAGAGAAAKALDYARRSAEHASKLLAFEESARLYRLALHLQQLHFARDATLRCELLLSLGEAEESLGIGEPALAAYQQAADLARHQGLPRLFARAAVGFEEAMSMAATLRRAGGGPAARSHLAAYGRRPAARRTARAPVPRLCVLQRVQGGQGSAPRRGCPGTQDRRCGRPSTRAGVHRDDRLLARDAARAPGGRERGLGHCGRPEPAALRDGVASCPTC